MGILGRTTKAPARAIAGAVLMLNASFMLIASTAPAYGVKPVEPGNSQDARAGTIKIAELGDDTAPDNDPKPGCAFRVDFYGFRAGTLDITLAAHPPTGRAIVGTDTVVIDETEHGNTWQASRGYDIVDELRALTDDSRYHVKVSAKRRGSHGLGAKHKVLWLECPLPAGTIGPRPPTTTPPNVGVSGKPPVRAPKPRVRPGGGTPPRPAPRIRVLGDTHKPPAVAKVAGGTLASTGSALHAIAQMAALLLLSGAIALRASKRSMVRAR